MKPIFLIQLLFLMATATFSHASAEGGVGALFTEVTVLAGESGYQFVFHVDKEGRLEKVVCIWEGRTTTSDMGVLGKVDDAYLRGIKINAPHDKSVGKQPIVIVVLPYGWVRSADGATSVNVARFIFDRGRLIGWEKAERDPNVTNKWILSTWDDESGVQSNGNKISDRNPYEQFKFGSESP